MSRSDQGDENTTRVPPTPGGLERMARGELDRWDPEMYANMNTGVLEQYLDEGNRNRAFQAGRWPRGRVLLGVLAGTLFALVNAYVGLKLGLIVAGAWYAVYLLAVGEGWPTRDTVLASGAATGASFAIAGFVFTYPALVLLREADHGSHSALLAGTPLPGLWLLVPLSVLAGLLGAVAFLLYRRVWTVETPLPYPRSRSFVRLLDLGRNLGQGARERTRRGLRLLAGATVGSAVVTALRDLPLANGRPVLQALTGDAAWWRQGGTVATPPGSSHLTVLGVSLSPLLAAVGWFLRLRATLVLAAGTLFTWLIVVPLAVTLNVPVAAPTGARVGLETLWQTGFPSATLAFQGPGTILAAGALVGAGSTALLRASDTVRSALRDLVELPRRWARSAYEPGRGWYGWPPRHAALLLALLPVATAGLLLLDGWSVGPSLVLSFLVALAVLVLGAAAVKVLGETSLEPVSATAFVLFLLLVAGTRLTGAPTGDAVVLALVGTTVFGAAVALAGNVLLDLKTGLYVGARPFDQVKAATAGLLPGLLAGGLAAGTLALALAAGQADLAAPQARTFAVLAEVVAGTRVPLLLLLVGVALGVFVELITSVGATFALGMFLPFGYVAPLVLGGAARAWWESRRLDAEAPEEERTMRLLDTYMLASGLVVGEALVGVLAAAWIVGLP